MTAPHALIYHFPQERAVRGAQAVPRGDLTDIQSRIERCCQWLVSQNLTILGFVGSTLGDPVVFVSAHPNAWAVFAGRTHRNGYKQEGALRYEFWEGRDRINHINVRWQEVVACA